MFIGHFAVGFGAKKFAPRASLAVLLAAPLFADLLWPVFLLLGWERVRIDPVNTRFTPLDLAYFPWSHSLLMLLLWACVYSLVYYGISRYVLGAVVVWIGVVSHWVLDWVTHRPDMPMCPGGTRYGLGLWNSITGTMVAEIGMVDIGVWLYVRRHERGIGSAAGDSARTWPCSFFCTLATASAALLRRCAILLGQGSLLKQCC